MEFPGTPTKIYQISVQRMMWSKLAHAFALISLDLIIHRTDILYIFVAVPESIYFTLFHSTHLIIPHHKPHTAHTKSQKRPLIMLKKYYHHRSSLWDHWFTGAIGMFNETNKLTHENIKSTVKKRHVKTVMFILTHLLCIFIL